MISDFQNKHNNTNMNRSEVINLFIDDIYNQVSKIIEEN